MKLLKEILRLLDELDEDEVYSRIQFEQCVRAIEDELGTWLLSEGTILFQGS